MNPISFFWLARKTNITFHDCFYLVTPSLGLCSSNQISDLAFNFQFLHFIYHVSSMLPFLLFIKGLLDSVYKNDFLSK